MLAMELLVGSPNAKQLNAGWPTRRVSDRRSHSLGRCSPKPPSSPNPSPLQKSPRPRTSTDDDEEAFSFHKRLPFQPSLSMQEFFPADTCDNLLLLIGEKPAVDDLPLLEDFLGYFRKFFGVWKQHDKRSYLALQGLLYLLEACLDSAHDTPKLFETFAEQAGSQLIPVLKEALPWLIDCEMLYGHGTIDILLVNLCLFTVHTGRNVLAAFITAVPYFNGFYLGKHSKRFEELYAYIHTSEKRSYDEDTKTTTTTFSPHYLNCMHFPMRKIIVSNAPPVKLRRSSLNTRSRYNCDFSAGGLVTGIKPSLGSQDIWVSYLDPALIGLDRMPKPMASRIVKESIRIPAFIRRSPSIQSTGSLSGDDDDTYNKLQDYLWEKTENDWLGLQKRLDAFAEKNFTINPLVILKDDHTAFYNGISNGLFWPAFHDLPEHIISNYKGEANKASFLKDDWAKYIKVNFHFAIHAARSCRIQDFIWIHDYHLLLVGLILRSLEPNLNFAFFLHIPFKLSDQFMTDYYEEGIAVLRGLLGYKQVGFQTSRDCKNFVKLVEQHLQNVKVSEKLNCKNGFTIYNENGITDVGTFPISIKVETIVNKANSEETAVRAKEMREKILSASHAENRECCVFLSVERFDYTKGIIERLQAIRLYFQKHPERVGKDVFYQVAASSRGDVSSYEIYQTRALDLAKHIEAELLPQCPEDSNWSPVIMDTCNHPQDEVIELYRACDVIVVTPVADGMNLVIKEAVMSNPAAVFVLSTGAGAESQFYDAGLTKCYFRVEDIADAEKFSDILYNACQTPSAKAIEQGQRLADFVSQHDIAHWIQTQTDPGWTETVVQRIPSLVDPNSGFIQLLERLQHKRKAAVNYLSISRHITEDFDLSLSNLLHLFREQQKANNSLEIYADGSLVEIDGTKLIHGLQLDVSFVAGYKAGTMLSSLYEVFGPTSGLSETDFEEQLRVLMRFISKVGFVDLLVIKYEDALATPGAGGFAPNSHSYLALAQTIASGYLLHRFTSSCATESIILTDVPLERASNIFTFPDRAVTLVSNSNLLAAQDEEWQIFKDKTILFIGCVEKNEDFQYKIRKMAKRLFVMPIQTEVTDDTAFSLGAVTAPEVLFAAMAETVVRPVSITG